MSTFDRLALGGVLLLFAIPLGFLFLSWKYADLVLIGAILATVFILCVVIPVIWLVTE